MEREKFSSRLGFILISAGCAIGLGNVWRFPYITGKYGGGAFVLLYIFFLIVLGIPIMVVELSVGRASKRSVALSFDVLEPKGSKWHFFKYFAMFGSYLLMMYYTTVTGWIVLYFFKTLKGDFVGMDTQAIADSFTTLTTNPLLMACFMSLVVIGCFAICAQGLQSGVERIVKVMMVLLLGLMVVLAVNSLFLPGRNEGILFYLKPDFSKVIEVGLSTTIFAALGQAFFTLGLGIGSMSIFGSYIDQDRSLTGEAITITALDTAVAILAGIIIFPACFSFGIEPQAGPSLLFITLPNVFNAMAGGRIWGSMFFLFMSFAALSTVVAMFQAIVSYATDLTGCSIKKACIINGIAIIILSLPCVLGFNLLSSFHPMGIGTTILDFEDFIISNNIIPIGSIIYVLFTTTRYGWGYDAFIDEANTGKGLKFPNHLRIYMTFILPLLILSIFIWGYIA